MLVPGVQLPPMPKIVPRVKMKGMFWTKLKPNEVSILFSWLIFSLVLSAQLLNSLWLEVVTTPAPIDVEELEDIFGDETATSTASRAARANTADAPNLASTQNKGLVKGKLVSLFDSKRSQARHFEIY